MKKILKSRRLANVQGGLHGRVSAAARMLTEAGHTVIDLGFGDGTGVDIEYLNVLQCSMAKNIQRSSAYSESKGIRHARMAVVDDSARQGVAGVEPGDVYIGNGASELICMAVNALLDSGDELLIPAPGVPLWGSAAAVAGGRPIFYESKIKQNWVPTIADIEKLISPRTKGIVVVNPGNPSGSLYPRSFLLQIVNIARRYNIILFADEVCNKLLFDGKMHVALGSLSTDVLTLTFNSLSKNFMAGGYRAGWMTISGAKAKTLDLVAGFEMLSNMRLCSNLPGQWAIAAALNGQPTASRVAFEGCLEGRRNFACSGVSSLPGVRVVPPDAGIHLFAQLDPAIYPIDDDEAFFLRLLDETGVLLLPGSAFHVEVPCHFRMAFLAPEPQLQEGLERLANFLERNRQHQPLAEATAFHACGKSRSRR
jgi:alanine-synthesizing transaminase